MYQKIAVAAGVLAVGLGLVAAPARAERPRVYAITNVKIVAAPGRVIDQGTVVLRDGLIEAVGAKVIVPPDAVEIDGTGKIVYPGLIDAYTHLGLRRATGAAPAAATARGGPGRPAAPAPIMELAPRRETPAGAVHPISRVRPETQARDQIVRFDDDDGRDAERYRGMGFTTVLTVPESGIFRGESALINLRDGAPAPDLIVKDRVAQHVALEAGGFRGGGGGYPVSLMGVAATVRQVLLDADRHLTWRKRHAAQPAGMRRPETSPALEALAPALDRLRPVVFEVESNLNALLADRLAREFNLKAVLAGSGLEWEQLEQIKATGRTLILPAAIPEKPKVDDPEEVLNVDTRELRRYVQAPENPRRLHEAGLRFALSTRGLRNPADFPRHMRKIIEAGLPADVALAALTTVPAEMFGVSAMLGTVEPGKIANLFVADGDLFAEKTKVRLVFVDGHEYKLEEDRKAKGDPNAVVDPRGTWSVTTSLPGGRSSTSTWKIKGTQGDYSGTVESPRGTSEFSALRLEGNALTVTMPGFGRQGSMEITVIVTGESFEGTAAQGPMSVTVKGTRTAGPEGSTR